MSSDVQRYITFDSVMKTGTDPTMNVQDFQRMNDEGRKISMIYDRDVKSGAFPSESESYNNPELTDQRAPKRTGERRPQIVLAS